MRTSLPPYEFYESQRGNTGTPVALIHGLGGSHTWWDRNIDALATRHRVAAIDLVGFGRNQHFFAPPSVMPPFGEMSALIARWLETFGEPVHLVAHSMGGLIAIRVAAERPELLRSLTLVSAAGIPFALDPRAHLRAMPRPIRGTVDIIKFASADFLRAGVPSLAVAGARILTADVREFLGAIDIPVLLVWGDQDPVVPLRYGEEMHAAIRGSRMTVLHGAAHVPMWECAEEFNETLLRWLDEVDARPMHRSVGHAFGWGVAGYVDGIAYRDARRTRTHVLVHGLGMSSAYFEPLARALHARGCGPVAPDLPGFGESANARAMSPAEQAQVLASWADALAIRDATWIGHSTGCHAVAHLAAARPDVVRDAVYIGALWRRTRFRTLSIAAALALDAFREPARLWPAIVRAYWRCGLARWVATFFRGLHDTRCDAKPERGTFITGDRDPLVDRSCITNVHEVPGAHACFARDPEATASYISSTLGTRSGSNNRR